jgi:hypothetical protein
MLSRRYTGMPILDFDFVFVNSVSYEKAGTVYRHLRGIEILDDATNLTVTACLPC